jgi:hypothetical protein
MQDTIKLAVVGLAVVASISVAVVVEWIGLWGLMKMMPGPEPMAAPVALVEPANLVAENVSIPHTERAESLHHSTRVASAR